MGPVGQVTNLNRAKGGDIVADKIEIIFDVIARDVADDPAAIRRAWRLAEAAMEQAKARSAVEAEAQKSDPAP